MQQETARQRGGQQRTISKKYNQNSGQGVTRGQNVIMVQGDNDWIRPVSYTHLDVYKRQGWRRRHSRYPGLGGAGRDLLRQVGEQAADQDQ